MIDLIVLVITIILCWSLGESAGHFWKPEKFENVANSDFENLKHLQKPGDLSLTAPSIIRTVRDFSKENYFVFIMNANKRTSSTMPFGYRKIKKISKDPGRSSRNR